MKKTSIAIAKKATVVNAKSTTPIKLPAKKATVLIEAPKKKMTAIATPISKAAVKKLVTPKALEAKQAPKKQALKVVPVATKQAPKKSASKFIPVKKAALKAVVKEVEAPKKVRIKREYTSNPMSARVTTEKLLSLLLHAKKYNFKSAFENITTQEECAKIEAEMLKIDQQLVNYGFLTHDSKYLPVSVYKTMPNYYEALQKMNAATEQELQKMKF